MRCLDCYDCDQDDIRLQRCDGAMILTLPNEDETVQFQEFTAQPGDTRPTFPCPLKATHGCDKIFLNSEHAAHHAGIHTPMLPFPCPFQGCDRHFARENDRDLHLATHTAVAPITCPIPSCSLCFMTEEDKYLHLNTHFRRT